MTLWDALSAEWDATSSILVTFWRSDGVRYTFGAMSYFWTLDNPAQSSTNAVGRKGAGGTVS